MSCIKCLFVFVCLCYCGINVYKVWSLYSMFLSQSSSCKLKLLYALWHSALFSSFYKNSKFNTENVILFHYFVFNDASFFFFFVPLRAKLWICLTAGCKHYIVCSDQAVVIFHDYWTLPHPSPQHLQLIRPPLPSLPLVHRHLYSCALCLATSTGAILDRIYKGIHQFNVYKSISPWDPLNCYLAPLPGGYYAMLGLSPSCVPGVGCFFTPGLCFFMHHHNRVWHLA